MLLTGYHGTTKAKGLDIVEMKYFHKSNSSKEWLGAGIYFYFEYKDAMNWVKEHYTDDFVVLHGIVDVKKEQVIDFDSNEGICYYRSAISILKKEYEHLIAGTAQENQCAIANFIWNEWSEIKVLIASFASVPSEFRMLKDAREKRREFCVRSNDFIKNVQLIEG